MSRANSPAVVSNQISLHPRLDEAVDRHMKNVWKQPFHDHTLQVFESLSARVGAHDGPLVLDSGCGTGRSTANLAGRHRDALVIGVDRSEARLARAPAMPPNAVLVRAELADFWRLAAAAGWRLDYHYLLYPNPWPKAEHLMRRWHAHPVFPAMLALGGRLEVRSNWLIYVQEFARALEVAGHAPGEPRCLEIAEPLTPFERKYLNSGHELYELIVNLSLELHP